MLSILPPIFSYQYYTHSYKHDKKGDGPDNRTYGHWLTKVHRPPLDSADKGSLRLGPDTSSILDIYEALLF